MVRAIEIKNRDGAVCITVRADAVLGLSRYSASHGDEEVSYGCTLLLAATEVRLDWVEPGDVMRQLGWAKEIASATARALEAVAQVDRRVFTRTLRRLLDAELVK